MSTYTFVEKRHKSVFRILSKGRVSLVISGILFGTTVSYAAPSGGSVVSGDASITSSGNMTTINQSSNKASINWQDFSIRSNESVNFVQPSASSITLNRVIGTEKSLIDGMLNANGQVFILNSNGILFGKNSSVNTAGLVASTMNLSNDDFMAGKYRFSNNGSTASVVNEGTINISNGGYAAFLAQSVKNGGIVRASLGKVLLSSGEQITLNIAGNTLVDFTIDKVALDTLIENHGAIYANGGEIYLTTKAVDNLVKGVVNNTGILEAQTLGTHEGKIVLWGETTNIAGTLDASAPDGGNGGFIETSGDHVTIAEGTRVTTKASEGKIGTWLIDPTDFTVAASGGDMSGTTLSSNLGSTNVLIQSALGSSGSNGDVNINDAVSWNADTVLTLDATSSININADVTATGANAGLVMLYSGDYNLNAPITLSGAGTTLNINGSAYTLIHTMADFQNINGNLSGLYALGQDISSSGTYGDAVVGNFSGVFAGMGHTISDLTINTNGNYLGLFRSNSGMIRNFGVLNGSVQSTDAMIGGLVGINTGTIRDSFYSGSVYVPYANGTGGLVAWNRGGIIKDSYSTGTVTGNDAVGGVVGYNENGGIIQRTYSTATVTSLNAQRHGGIVGANNSGTVSDSYATSQIAGGSIYGTVSGGGVLDANQMKNAANFSGWDIATTGGSNSKLRIYEGASAPLLRAFLRSLTVSADSGTRTYDGTTDGFGVTYSVTPDATLLGMATTMLSSKNAGTRTVRVDGLYSNQQGYDVLYVDGTATIEQKEVTLTSANILDKVYDGTTAAVMPAIGFNGILNSDLDFVGITGYNASFDTKDAGTNKNVHISGVVIGGVEGANYRVVNELDTSASITAKTINIASATADDKVYDGTTTATLSAINVSGIITGDSVTTAADASFDNKDVGTNKNVRLSGITITGTDASNYWMADEFYDTSASITPKTISSGSTVIDKTYDSTTTATTATTLNGVIAGDSVAASGNGTFDTKNVGVNKVVTVSGIALSGTDMGNYVLDNIVDTTTATINAKMLSVSGASASDKTYDGTNVATVSGGSLSGVLIGDSVTLSQSGTFNNKNAGTNKAVAETFGIIGTDANNYLLSSTTASTTATINKVTINIASATANDKVYDGTTTATLSNLSVSGIITGDSVTTTADASFDNKDVGTNKNVRVSGITVTGTDASNYWMADEFYDTSASISAIPIIVTPFNGENNTVHNGELVNVSHLGTKNEPYLGERSPYTAFADTSDTKRTLTDITMTPNEHAVSSNNSIITLVDGGVRLPDGVQQSYYKNKDSK